MLHPVTYQVFSEKALSVRFYGAWKVGPRCSSSRNQKRFIPTNKRSMNKRSMNKRRGRAGSQKYFNYENTKQNKAMKKTRL